MAMPCLASGSAEADCHGSRAMAVTVKTLMRDEAFRVLVIDLARFGSDSGAVSYVDIEYQTLPGLKITGGVEVVPACDVSHIDCKAAGDG